MPNPRSGCRVFSRVGVGLIVLIVGCSSGTLDRPRDGVTGDDDHGSIDGGDGLSADAGTGDEFGDPRGADVGPGDTAGGDATELGPTAYLSHDQYMVTFAGAVNGDVVGVFDPWYPTQDITGGTFSYSLVDSNDGTYAIDSVTGVVTVANSEGLVAGTDRLTVATTLGARTQHNFAHVRVMPTTSCVFIDPSASSNGTGTRGSPFNSWSQVTFETGKAFLQKRGTTNTEHLSVDVGGTEGSEVILGAYGTGARPIVTCGASTIGMQIYGSYVQVYEYVFDTNYYGIMLETYGLSAAPTHCLFSDIDLRDSATINGALYYIKMEGIATSEKNDFYHRAYDIVAEGGYYGMKIEGNRNLVENFRGDTQTYQGISIPIWGNHNTIRGVSASYTTNGMEVSGTMNDVSYSYFLENYRGIVVDDPGSQGSVIHHSLFVGSTGDDSIKLRANGDFWQEPYEPTSLGSDITVEDNEIRDNSYSAGVSVEYAMERTTIRRNLIHDNNYGIQIGANNEGIDTVNIHYNVLYGNTTDIYGAGGANILVYNNTSDGTIDCSGTSGNEAKNNFFKALTGSFVSSKNLDIDDITVSEVFVDRVAHAYALRSTAVDAIDTGDSLSLASDIVGTLVPQGTAPDIGAYEYVEP